MWIRIYKKGFACYTAYADKVELNNKLWKDLQVGLNIVAEDCNSRHTDAEGHHFDSSVLQ